MSDDQAQQPEQKWPLPDHKHGMPFKFFPRDATAREVYEWIQDQRRKAGKLDDIPPADPAAPPAD